MKNKKFTRAAKYALVAAVAASMTLTSAVAFAADGDEATSWKYGDVDMNGAVESSDALLVLQNVVDLADIEDETALILADINQDGEITSSDALLILQTVVSLVDEVTYVPETEPTEDVTAAPAETETPAATESTEPTPTPEATIPAAWLPNEIPTVDPGDTDPVDGTQADAAELNGADYDEETGIYTFTDENATNVLGIQFENPLAGRTDLRMTVDQALEGQPDYATTLTKLQLTQYDSSAIYSRPVWTNGVSISFWVKCDWKNTLRPDASPILVVTQNEEYYIEEDGSSLLNVKDERNFALMVRLNGSVRYESGDQPHNSFRANSVLAGNNGEWNYYTVTFSNDWITVYVNGQENVYTQVSLLKDESLEYFNDGFMTRYNTVGTPTEEDAENDIRGYLLSGSLDGDSVVGNVEASIIGNGRYANEGAVTGGTLLIDYITAEETQIWLGGIGNGTTVSSTIKLASAAQELDPPYYSVSTGTQVAGLTTYDVELTAEQVAANYAAATTPDGDPVSGSEDEETVEESEEPTESEDAAE